MSDYDAEGKDMEDLLTNLEKAAKEAPNKTVELTEKQRAMFEKKYTPISPISPVRSPPRKRNRIMRTPEKQENKESDQDGPEVRWGDVEEPTWAFMEGRNTLWKKINIIKIAGKKSLGLVLDNMNSNLNELYVKDFKKEVDPTVKLQVPQGSIMLEIKYYKHTPKTRNKFIASALLYHKPSFKGMPKAIFEEAFLRFVNEENATHVRILFAKPNYLLIQSKTIDLTFKFRF